MQIENNKYRLFGRTKVRGNKKINIKKYNDLINKYKTNFLNKNEEYILDIGSGYGETTLYLAKKYISKKIISCDKFINGNYNLLKNIENNNLNNVFLHTGNVNEILDKNEKQEYFNLIWIFFPDPWPKKKHFKRRLINNLFLIKIYNFLKEDGKIIIATDSTSYSRSILNTIFEIKNLYKWSNQRSLHLSTKDYFDIETKFYKKAINCGKKPSLFILEKI
tara:strand:+ start:418 stop:1077 length:660 start_codon:yes stop_codon:yes gene_type:complete